MNGTTRPPVNTSHGRVLSITKKALLQHAVIRLPNRTCHIITFF